ncbi:trinucleotide repeat-containing gene 6B protein-like isoform X4 [Oncorhynchus clarkii lewisi]|uniref:trinucleotide repeat-containing gene 6B protein-like isoform X4 n=1 Tax=Oncorhynchus clarkii lewisi TaxID=490388 RepID=UPI0039B86BEE
MEDKKRKKEDKRKREASQKVAEQKNKVPELTKPSSTQSPAAPSSACPSPGPTPSASPSPATAAAGVAPPQGGNNAKRPAVANGQPPAAGTQASQRYMPREVPPRFRCQQDHKVLLKRGQPPLSSMLLGGGTGPGGGGGDCPNATMAAASDSSPGYVGPAAPSLPLTSSSSSIAASSTTSSNYANSTWGVGSGSLPSSQGREKVIVDGSDLEEWPSIAVGDGNGAGGGEASGTGSGSASSGEGGGGVPNSSALRKGGDPGSPPSPTSSFSTPNECMLSVSVVWGSAASQGPPGTSVPSIPKASPLPMGPDGSLGGSGVIPGANFNPNANPSAWPALVQQDGAGVASSEGAPPPSLLQSLAGSLSAPGLGNPPLAVNQSAHQHQLHQMQSRDREHTSDGGWGGAALETGAGPKNEGTGVGADTDCGGGGNGGENLAASQTSSSSWGGQPFPAANSKTGASRTDGWEGGAAEGGGGSGWKYSAQGGNGGKSWGAGRGGSTQTPGVSQGGGAGGERGSSVGDWGGNSGGMGGGGNPGGEAGGVGGRSSSSSSSGGSNPPAASSSPTTSTTTTRAWDNQKGDGVAGGDTGEWGGGKGGRGGNSSSGGGNSRGSGNQHHGYGHHRYSHPPPPNPDVALQAMLSRSDLDPRVLSNTGWGQTQIRQNVAWDLEPGKGGSGSSASSQNASPPMGPSSQYSTGSATTTDPMAPTPLPGSAPNLNSNPSLGTPGGSGEGWEVGNNGSSSGSNSMPSQGPPPLGSNMKNPPGVTQSGSMTTGAGIGGGLGPGQGKPTGGWGGVGPGESQGKGWGNEGSEWGCGRERSRGGGGGGWGDNGQQGNQGGGGVGGWGGGQEEKGTGGGWKEMGRDGGGWGGQRDRGGGDWGEREPKSSGGGWGEDRKGGGNSGGGDSEVGTWGSWDEGAPRRSWGAGGTGGGGGGGVGGDMGCTKPHQGRWGGGGKMHPSPMPNSQTASVKGAMALQQHSQPPPQQALEPGGGGWVRQPGAQHQNQSSSGWIAGPIPSGPGGGEGPESSGWEEPSPQFISRKMDIDDGTSAWGDPSQFNKKTVNLWEKNGSPAGHQPEMQGQGAGPPTQQQQGLPALQQPGPGRQPTGMGGRDINPGPGRQPTGMGGRDINPGPGRQPTGMGGRDINPGKAPGMAPSSGWDGGSPSDPPVDNGTAAWGKPTETPTGWEDPGKTTSGWGNPSPNPIKSGSKSMQEGSWGEGDQGSVAASRHSSWEEEEEGGGGVWSSAGSQGSSSSYNSGGWGQSHGGKKPNKAPLKSGGGDSWMNSMNKQFSNMGLLGDDPSGRPLDLAPGPSQDKKMEGEKRGMGLNDYNGEMRKGGQRGVGGGGMVYRSPGSKEIGPGDPGPCYDKPLPFTNQDGCLGEEYSPPTVYKPSPLYSHTIPPRQGGHNMFGGCGGGMPQSRHQPGVPPINTSAGIRAQVPHQYLSPQVPGSMLKQVAPPSAGVGGVGGVSGVAGVGGGVFPPQLSPQHIAMLSGIYPPHIQFQLACQLLLQQQQNPQQLTSPQQLQQLLQNQRKFPQNLRQQADPQQLARIVAVLQQQRQQQGVGGGAKLSPSDLGGGGPKLPMTDSLPHPGMGGSVDLHQKTQGYSGYGGGVNLSGLDMGGSVMGGPGGMKDMGGQQSRFKWMMEGHSPAPSPPESLNKNGPMSTPMRRGGSPYSQYDMMGGEGLGMPLQRDNWHRTPGNKMGSKPQGTSSWPPEFQPGVPWKGIQSIDPESDPYMTPGSMMGIPGPSSLNDTEHQLLRDNTEANPSLNTLLPSPGAWPYSASDSPLNNAHNSAKYTEYKTSWPPEPIGHNKMWKTNRNQQSQQLPRPPPGLTNQKQASPSRGPWQARGWGSSSGSQETRYGPGSAWSDGGTSRGSCWLVLCNLTPQIDGSTLRTICMQHGPLLTFHLGLTQGSALIRYSTPQEAAKAQSALHMCVLGNTTILAKFVSEEEVARYFAHSQAGGASGSQGGPTGTGAVGANSSGGSGERERDRTRGGGESSAPGGGGSSGPVSSGWQSLDSTGGCLDTTPAQGPGLSMFAQWSSNGAGVAGGVEPSRQGLWGGMGGGGYPSSSMWGSPAIEDPHQMGSPAALLPGDLLGGGADSI